MPLIPEAVIAMLACSRIGAIHSVVFGGFSAPSLSERINDSDSNVSSQPTKQIEEESKVKNIVDEALKTVKKSISIVTLN